MCVRPINVDGKVVPCGRCHKCKQKVRNDWALRLKYDFKEGMFITLTYRDEDLPEDGKVDKKVLQDYIKRVREEKNRKEKRIAKKEKRSFSRLNIKYFGVGEYGGKHGRPHYHVLINFVDPDLIAKQWNYGNVHIGEVNNETILYSTKYIQKVDLKYQREKDKEFREFRIMSKNIGSKFIEKNREHYRKNKLLYTVVDGKKYSIPRYWKERIFGELVEYVDTDTGEIKKKYTNTVDLREVEEEQRKKQMEKLIKIYGGKLKKEIKEQYIYRKEKYEKMYETLRFIKNVDK